MRLKIVLKLRCSSQHFFLSGSWSRTRRSRTTRTRRCSTETNEFLGTPQIFSTFLYLIGFRLFFLGPLLLQDQPAGLFATRSKKPVEKSPTNERFRTFSSSGLQLNGNVLLVTHVTHLIHEMRVTHVTLMTHVMQSGARTSSQCHQQ